ncbi:MAG: ribonuclease P protein component [Alphaproteobacteria bacterium]
MERLKRRQDFLRVAAKRNSAARPGMVLQAAHRPDDATEGSVRFGLTVSRKVGNAVERNRARRRLRAAALATLSAHGEAGVDYVLVGRRATLTRPFDKLMGDLAGAMRQVGCWRNDEAPGARAQGEAED